MEGGVDAGGPDVADAPLQHRGSGAWSTPVTTFGAGVGEQPVDEAACRTGSGSPRNDRICSAAAPPNEPTALPVPGSLHSPFSPVWRRTTCDLGQDYGPRHPGHERRRPRGSGCRRSRGAAAEPYCAFKRSGALLRSARLTRSTAASCPRGRWSRHDSGNTAFHGQPICGCAPNAAKDRKRHSKRTK